VPPIDDDDATAAGVTTVATPASPVALKPTTVGAHLSESYTLLDSSRSWGRGEIDEAAALGAEVLMRRGIDGGGQAAHRDKEDEPGCFS
jgi:hypothetical protein